MAEYTMDDAREEAFDLIENYVEQTKNHFATGDAACNELADMLLEQHIMPMERVTAYNFAVEYIKEHADVVDLSQTPQA